MTLGSSGAGFAAAAFFGALGGLSTPSWQHRCLHLAEYIRKDSHACVLPTLACPCTYDCMPISRCPVESASIQQHERLADPGASSSEQFQTYEFSQTTRWVGSLAG